MNKRCHVLKARPMGGVNQDVLVLVCLAEEFDNRYEGMIINTNTKTRITTIKDVKQEKSPIDVSYNIDSFLNDLLTMGKNNIGGDYIWDAMEQK